MGVYGKGEDCLFLEPTPTSGTTPVVGHPLNMMQDYDIVGLQLIVDPITENVDVQDGDNVDAAGTEFTFAAFDFTGLEGSTVRVVGAQNAGNNGDFIITTGADGSFVAAAAVGLVDEDFSPDTVTVTLISPDTMDGEWLIEISNDTTPAGMAGSYDQDSGVDGHWTDITSAFSPTIQPVVHGDAATLSQYVQATICVRSMRITFTPTTGSGSPTALGLARSYS